MKKEASKEQGTRILGRQVAHELSDEELIGVAGGYSCPSIEDEDGNTVGPHSGQIGDQPY